MKVDHEEAIALDVVLAAVDIEKFHPSLTLPVPPSDNNLAVPITRAGRATLVMSKKARAYKMAVAPLYKDKYTPPKDGWLVVLYKAYFDHKARDANNIVKVLLDVLFTQDNRVLAWALPPEIDKRDPRVEIWMVEI